MICHTSIIVNNFKINDMFAGEEENSVKLLPAW